MERLTFGDGGASAGDAQQVYRKTLGCWVSDLLANGEPCRWAESDAVEDHGDRDWRRLYAGDILDD